VLEDNLEMGHVTCHRFTNLH